MLACARIKMAASKGNVPIVICALVIHRLYLSGPVPEWTVREQLILASAVQRSGDQNWCGVCHVYVRKE